MNHAFVGVRFQDHMSCGCGCGYRVKGSHELFHLQWCGVMTKLW